MQSFVFVKEQNMEPCCSFQENGFKHLNFPGPTRTGQRSVLDVLQAVLVSYINSSLINTTVPVGSTKQNWRFISGLTWCDVNIVQLTNITWSNFNNRKKYQQSGPAVLSFQYISVENAKSLFFFRNYVNTVTHLTWIAILKIRALWFVGWFYRTEPIEQFVNQCF